MKQDLSAAPLLETPTRVRYGVLGSEPTPLVETGRRLGISQDAVRKLERRALTELAQSRELEALRPAA